MIMSVFVCMWKENIFVFTGPEQITFYECKNRLKKGTIAFTYLHQLVVVSLLLFFIWK